MTCYVIQKKVHPWDTKWVLFSNHRFDTLKEAKAFFDTLPIKTDRRIAEAYTVTRYKPVKGAQAVSTDHRGQKKTARGAAITESGKGEKGLENPYFTPDYTTKTGAVQV